MSIDIPYRQHQTKSQRFPRIYKMVERVLKLVKENKANVKTALYSTRIARNVFNRVYALTFNVVKHKEIIRAILKETQLLEREPFMRPEAVEIMIYEMAISKSALPGDNKHVLIMKQYQTEIEDAFNKLQNTSVANASNTYRSLPRYARIHTIAISVDKAVTDLERKGYKRIYYPSDISLKEYQALVLDLKKGQFLVDYHFKDLLVFACEENLCILKMYKKGQLFLEDKTSYVPVHVLSPEPTSVVLDCCAAPGMKTAHLVSVMENKGIIYAIDRDSKRCETLKSTLDIAGSKISHVFCKDFKDVNPNVHPYDSTKYILLDPSCSGSGMVSRMDEVTDMENSKSKERLNALAGLQIVLLKHALSFPQVERVVYSTCSITEEENEFVVNEALQHYAHKFQLVPAMPEWPERGLPGSEHREMFFRATPREHLTNGFFVAVFERVIATEDGATEGFARKKRKVSACKTPVRANEELEVDQLVVKKCKKMSKKHCLSETADKASTVKQPLLKTEGFARKERKVGACNAPVHANEEQEVDQPLLKKSKKMSKKHCLSERSDQA